MVNWVGYSINVDRERLIVNTQADLTTTLGQVTKYRLSNFYIKVRDLRTYAGKSTHASNLLITWRPFLDTLWAAVAQTLPHTMVCDTDPQ